MSANASYERSEEDLKVLTGIAVSSSSQQRLVHRQTFAEPEVSEPVEEMSVDGGKVQLRTPKGQPSEWRDHKELKRLTHNKSALSFTKILTRRCRLGERYSRKRVS